MDALLLVGDAFTDINQMRRDLLRKGLPKSYKTMCHPSKEVSTNWLFGDDVSKQLKDISEARTLAKSLKKAEDEDQNIPKYNKYPTAHYGKQNYKSGKGGYKFNEQGKSFLSKTQPPMKRKKRW